jgi:hypothetical protein
MAVFRQMPPRDLVTDILHHVGLSAGFGDIRWFSRDEISVKTVEEWLPLLEPYYVPCKARRFLDAVDAGRVVTILRHCLRAHNYELATHECVYNQQKQTLYQIQPSTSLRDLTEADLKVSFD